MSIKIKRTEAIDAFSEFIKKIDDFSFAKEIPENIKIEGLNAVVTGFINCLNEWNGSKIAGEFKTELLNVLREKHSIDIDVKSPYHTEQWENAAEFAYRKCYPCRIDEKKLLEGASRVLRKIDLFQPLPLGISKRIHYVPEKEIIQRFKLKMSKEIIGPPVFSINGIILDIDGNCYVENLCMFNITDYFDNVEKNDFGSNGIMK